MQGVYGQNFLHAGVDRRGRGQVFWFQRDPDGQVHPFPSIRAEVLRDGIEDREYINLLKKLAGKLGEKNQTEQTRQLVEKARELARVPDELVKTQFAMTRDVAKLLARRAEMADMIEKLQAALQR